MVVLGLRYPNIVTYKTPVLEFCTSRVWSGGRNLNKVTRSIIKVSLNNHTEHQFPEFSSNQARLVSKNSNIVIHDTSFQNSTKVAHDTDLEIRV